MGSTSLRAGDQPSERLRRWRVRHGGWAQLRHLIETAVESRMDLTALAYVLRHRPPRDLEEIERALVKQHADLENALAHVHRMIGYRDMPVSAGEVGHHGEKPGTLGAELTEIVAAGADE